MSLRHHSKELSFYHKPNFLIPISLKPDDVNLWYLKLSLLGLSEFIVWNIKIYDIGLHRYMDHNFEFVAKTHVLSGYNFSYPWRHSVLKMGYLRSIFFSFSIISCYFLNSVMRKVEGCSRSPWGFWGMNNAPPELKTMMNGIPTKAYFLSSFVHVPL